MSVDDIGCLPFAAYFQPGTDIGLSYSQQKAALHQLLRQSGPRDVPFVILPKLVRFRDITPQTLVRVSPYDLAASFGPGVSLKRVVLQIDRRSDHTAAEYLAAMVDDQTSMEVSWNWPAAAR